jgi:uncharacterized protein (TIGR04255 family)
MAESSRPFPDFDNPPVVETALGVEFAPLKGWTALHAGLFWNEIRNEYPSAETCPPLGSQIERFDPAGAGLPPQFIEIGPPARLRYWFVDSAQRRLLQVQDSRLIVNWRKAEASDPYPRYPACRNQLVLEWNRFCAHVRREGLSLPQVVQCEVTYVNHLLQGREWSTFSDLARVIAPWTGKGSDGPLPELDSGTINLRFTMPNQAGRLHVSVGQGIRFADGKDIIQMSLTARGAPASSSQEDICRWLDLGREWVVRRFVELTTAEMHKQWRRKA